MPSQSYKDIKRYLQVTKKLSQYGEEYLGIGQLKIIPHQGDSLFDGELPVDIKTLEKVSGKDIYGISHKDGEMYIQSIKILKKYVDKISDKDVLIPIDKFRNLKDLIKNPYKNRFVHTHLHCEKSSLDGMSSADDIARRCKQLDFKAIALTDHGTMAGVIDFYEACKKYGIKPIIGQEFYIDDDRHQKGMPTDGKKKKPKSEVKKAYEKEHRINLRRHLILLAKNNKGLNNLYKLSSIGYTEGFYYRPRIDWEVLEKYSEGIICSTACAGGIICGEDNVKDKINNLRKLVKIFGKDNLYLETLLINYNEQPKLNDEIFAIANKFKLKTICTVDSHYVDPDPEGIHRLYMKIGVGFSYGEGDYYIKSYLEMKESFNKWYRNRKYGWDYYEKAIETTLEIADKCNVTMELGDPKLPIFKVEEAKGYKKGDTVVSYFKKRIMIGWNDKIKSKVSKENLKIYKERLLHEIDIIIAAKFVEYLLIMLDFVDEAHRQGQFVNARGSAAGSLIIYLFGITSVDPIEENLLFERFISLLKAGLVDKSYIAYPDIDLDVSDRQAMIKYIEKKYGEDKVARIGSYNKSKIRQAIKSIADVTGFMKPDEANKITKAINKKATTFEEAMEQSEFFRNWHKIDKNKKWFDKYVMPIIGVSGYSGIHAAGIVISPVPLNEIMPMKVQEKKKEKSYDEGEKRLMTTQFDGDAVEKAGLVKFDILGVKTLKRLQVTKELIKERRGKDIDFNKINLNNSRWYKDGFQKVDTLGVFQFEGGTAAKILGETKVNNFKELTAVNALTRPGISASGMDSVYCRRKDGESFDYDHPLLESILKESYGIVLYQEMLMQVFHKIGGLSLVEADKMRKILKKKDKIAMEALREKFVAGAMKNNMERKDAMKLFDKTEDWNKYGFNRSHASAYSQVAVWCMAMKLLCPQEFYIGLLKYPKNKNVLYEVKKDIKKHNIEIILPDINRSKLDFNIEGKNIVWSLKGIKNIGDGPAEAIGLNAPYKSIEELIDKTKTSKNGKEKTIVDKKVMDALISVNAFKSLGMTQREAARDYYVNQRRKELAPEFDIKDDKYWNKQFYKYMGFYMINPIELYGEELKQFGKMDSYEEFLNLSMNEDARMAGNICFVKKINSKNGMMAICKIEVDDEEVSFVLWNSFYKNHPISQMPESEIMGAFVLIYGQRNYDQQGRDQIQMSNAKVERVEFL